MKFTPEVVRPNFLNTTRMDRMQLRWFVVEQFRKTGADSVTVEMKWSRHPAQKLTFRLGEPIVPVSAVDEFNEWKLEVDADTAKEAARKGAGGVSAF